MDAILGELSPYRIRLISKAFEKLDANGNGTLELSEVKEKFDPTRHPDVLNGHKTVEECRFEFFDLFQSHHSVEKNFA